MYPHLKGRNRSRFSTDIGKSSRQRVVESNITSHDHNYNHNNDNNGHRRHSSGLPCLVPWLLSRFARRLGRSKPPLREGGRKRGRGKQAGEQSKKRRKKPNRGGTALVKAHCDVCLFDRSVSQSVGRSFIYLCMCVCMYVSILQILTFSFWPWPAMRRDATRRDARH